MQPIHEGKPAKALYSGAQFQSVTVCLDSGKLATAACANDVRGSRTATVNCYPEDMPTEYCDKHVEVNYCVSGEGVATEYCGLMADGDVQSRSLVKLTPAEIAEIQAAIGNGLEEMYYLDSYVYAVDEDGNPTPWHGFRGGANAGSDAPYIVCTTHTHDTWQDQGSRDETIDDTTNETGGGHNRGDRDNRDDGSGWVG